MTTVLARPREDVLKLPRSAAGWTIAVFGVLAFLMGAVGLLWPEAQLRMLGFELPAADGREPSDHTGTFLAAASMASFNMGVYYLVAAATEWRPFFWFTVPFRVVTVTVFVLLVVGEVAPAGFLGVALWEGAGALATGVGLWLDARRAKAGRAGPSSGAVESASAPVAGAGQ